MLTKINLYLNNLNLDFNIKSKLVIHAILLPYLYSFYLYYSKELIQIIIDGFNLTCTYTQPFSPYYEYFILLFFGLAYFRLYINSLIFAQKKIYIFGLIFYFFLLICILFYCDLYSNIHSCWSIEEQKEIYKLHFNLAVVCFIFLYLFISFFFFDLISVLYFLFPIISLSTGVIILILFYFQELSYVEFINQPVHNCFQEIYSYLRKIFTIECMNTNTNEKALPVVAEAKTGEVVPKNIFQRTGELMGGYRYEQKHVECLKSGMSVEYEDLKNGNCNVIIRQCYDNPQLTQGVDTAIKKNLPGSDTVLGSVIDKTVGTPIRIAATPGIETKVEIKESACREITTKLIRSIENLDLKKSS